MENYRPQPDQAPEEDSISSEVFAALSAEIIGTREEPGIVPGSQVRLADGEMYSVEAVDYNGKGVIIHQTQDPELGYTLSFEEFVQFVTGSL